MSTIIKADAAGTITLPAELCQAAGVEPGAELEADLRDGRIVVGPARPTLGERIAALAILHRLPAIFPYRYFTASGGLVSYGSDTVDLMRQAASYVDRILKGEKPSDLPVQAPTKFELAINLKTAKALSLTIPETLLATADEVIQ